MASHKKIIHVTIHQDDKSKLEYLIDRFKYIVRDVVLSDPVFQPKSEYVNYSISFSYRTNLEILLEALIINGFEIDSSDELVALHIEKSNNKYLEDLRRFAASVDIKRKINKTHNSLDTLVTQGQYRELIKISKDITYTPDTITLARASISLSVSNAIFKVIEKNSTGKMNIDEATNELFAIATDKELPFLNCTEWMTQAGKVAIELSAKTNSGLKNLIKICNQKSLNQLVNIAAAIKFSEVALAEPIKYEESINYASKELNTRWLYNIAEPYRDTFSEEENELLDNLINFIRETK